uniref:Uncharacterized protein n=1 Tax=Acrobeloides nanus TaxID=290746 RepID=A0A914BW40_9BILA
MLETILFWLTLVGILYYVITSLLERLRVGNLTEKPVLITGCDTGFGHDLALKCLQEGMPVLAGCLTQQGCDGLKLIAKNRQLNLTHLHTFLLDVRSDESVKNARKFVEEYIKSYNGLYGLVNNAGIVGNASFDDWLLLQDYKDVFDINTLGVIRMTHAFKDLIKKTKGRIVTAASICARVALPGLGPYTVSKFAVASYMDTIRLELGIFGVSVSMLEPGFFKTPLTSAKRNSEMMDKLWNRATPETREEYGEKFFKSAKIVTQRMLVDQCNEQTELVVDAYFHALTSYFPRARYQVGNDSIFGFIPFSFLPSRWQDWFFKLTRLLTKLPFPKSVSGK